MKSREKKTVHRYWFEFNMRMRCTHQNELVREKFTNKRCMCNAIFTFFLLLRHLKRVFIQSIYYEYKNLWATFVALTQFCTKWTWKKWTKKKKRQMTELKKPTQKNKHIKVSCRYKKKHSLNQGYFIHHDMQQTCPFQRSTIHATPKQRLFFAHC